MCNLCYSRRDVLKSVAALSLVSAAPLQGCTKNTHTGRKQLSFVSDKQLTKLALQDWKQINRKYKKSKNKRNIASVGRVGKRIAAVSDIQTNWEFTVFAGENVNAFVLPGGKVAIFDGLFKAAKNDAQLAAVIGHEIGHITGKHVNERVSQSTASNLSLVLLSAFGVKQQTVEQVGVGLNLGLLLPFSRKQELEADVIGLKYMHNAGYNTYEAINLWRNMGRVSKSRLPEFLSTHPSPENRIEILKKEIKKL